MPLNFFHLIQNDFLRFFAENRDIDGWADIAFNWLMVAILISILSALLMLGVKWFLKRAAGVIRKQAWSRRRTIVFIVIGVVPVFILELIFYFASRDFQNIVGVAGFTNAVILDFILYPILVLLGHLGKWRRDIF